MSLFKSKRNIQLGEEQIGSVPSSQRLISGSSSKWSIPCCNSLMLGRSRAIQLPEDSDLEDDEYNQPDFSANNQSFIGHLPVENTPNVFLQNQTDNTTRILSHNPFARASCDDSSQKNKQNDAVIANNNQDQISVIGERFESETTGDEELSNFTPSSFTRYENEPDWTEPYKDDQDDEESRSLKEGFEIREEDIGDNIDTPNAIPDQPTVEEKVPQIEEEILRLLPLSQLSNEIPPTLIHRKSSFEKSMYGDKPLTSVSRTSSSSNNNTRSGSRLSRFSMTEEDYLAMKKKEDEKRKSLSFVAAPKLQDQPSTPKNDNDKSKIPQDISNIATTNIDTVSQLQIVSQDPLSSIVPSENTNDNQKHNVSNKQQTIQKNERRASIVSTAAHSLLGDKLDDFTEKLAYIKKNIIMSSDSDEEDEEVDNAESMLKKIEESKLAKSNSHESGSEKRPQTLHRRTSSLMDVAPTIARFMNHINGASTEAPATAQLSSSHSSTSSFSPSSLFSALAGPMPEPSPSTMKKRELATVALEESKGKETIQELEEDGEDEELFDFTKVIEIGKNMKTFSEGFVGEGIRMFNDVATRMKTELQQQEEEEERMKQQQQQQQENREEDEQNLPTILNTSSSTSSRVNEDEWMHNYL